MYISVMIGGGMLYIDDKARGVHEGYLVTPITKLELVFGLNIAGSIKAVLAGICLTVIGSLMAGLGVIFHPVIDPRRTALPHRRHLHRLQRHDVSAHGARRRSARAPRHVRRPQYCSCSIPRAPCIPSLHSPRWLQAISVIDPFTYAIHGFKAVLLKDGGFVAIQYDLLFLFVFGIGTLLIATPLFKRTL